MATVYARIPPSRHDSSGLRATILVWDTIALGTAAGQVQGQDESGQMVTLDVPTDTATLAQIAEITSATAFDAPTAAQLAAVYDNLQSRIGYTNEEQEVTSWFAAGALVLVVMAAGLSAAWFGRLP